MLKSKGFIAAVAVPAVLLAGGAGIGGVVAKERPAQNPDADRVAISPELVNQLRQAAQTETRQNADSLRKKKSCKKKKGKKPKRCRKSKSRGKKMSVKLADRKAENSARKAKARRWRGFAWEDHGSRNCNRLSRKSVTCLAWVDLVESGNDSDYNSTYTCQWWVKSSWVKKSRRGKRGKKSGFRVKVADRRARASCSLD